MACAALVQVGPLRQSFWAVLTRADGRLRERTRTLPRRGAVELVPGRPARSTGSESGPGVCGCATAVCCSISLSRRTRASRPSARTVASRCGRASRPASRRAARSPSTAAAAADRGAGGDRRHRRLPRPPHRVVVDRRGGHGPGRDALAWNLVSGVNDPPTGSERAVWVAGAPTSPRRCSFAADLSRDRRARTAPS